MSTVLDGDSVVPLVVALVCILGIGMGAATLETAVPVESDGAFQQPVEEDPGEEPGVDEGPSEPGDFGQEGTEDQSISISTCIEFLATLPGIGLVLLGVFAVVGVVYRRFNAATALLAGWTVFPPTMLVYFLSTNCGTGGLGGTAGEMTGAGPEPGSSPIAPVTQVPPWLLAVVALGVFVGAAVLVYRSTGEEETVVLEPEAEDEPELDRFAAAAGRAADRIEERNAGVDNAVFQAWVEMTSLLDVDDPETYAAGEFAEEAIALGMAAADVDELTRLFNEVRYGGKDAETREDRAIEVLRNIESEYGEPDSGDPGGPTDALDGAGTDGSDPDGSGAADRTDADGSDTAGGSDEPDGTDADDGSDTGNER